MKHQAYILCIISWVGCMQLCGSYSVLAFTRLRIRSRNGVYQSRNMHLLAQKEDLEDSSRTAPVKPEFSRIVHLSQVPRAKPVSCRLIAKQTERIALSERFNLGEVTYLAANVTICRQPPSRILIHGNVIAHMNYTYDSPDIFSESFESVLLNNYDSGAEKVAFEDVADCEDEVAPDGNIDVGEIVGEYLSLLMS